MPQQWLDLNNCKGYKTVNPFRHPYLTSILTLSQCHFIIWQFRVLNTFLVESFLSCKLLDPAAGEDPINSEKLTKMKRDQFPQSGPNDKGRFHERSTETVNQKLKNVYFNQNTGVFIPLMF